MERPITLERMFNNESIAEGPATMGSIVKPTDWTSNAQHAANLRALTQEDGGSGPAGTRDRLLSRRAARFLTSHQGRDEHLGKATSALPVLWAPLSSDKPSEPALDGHASSAVAGHHDGRFALNPASTSNYSLDANREHMLRDKTQTLDGAVKESQASQDAKTSTRRLVRALLTARALPKSRVVNEATVLEPQEAPTRLPTGSLLTGEWTVPQLALVAAAVLTLCACWGQR